MKAVILAAGQGARLRPLTDDRPKCMVEFQGRPIIDRLIETLRECGIDEIVVVGGYCLSRLEEHLRPSGVKICANPRFAATNMVYTLFCAEKEFDDDLIISYADIVYTPRVLKTLLENDALLATVVDRDWQRLWRARMQDVLSDAETMRVSAEQTIQELGRKPQTLEEIQGQYIGLTMIRRQALAQVAAFYHRLDPDGLYDGKPRDAMFMTSFLQLLIERVQPVRAAWISGGWAEIDSLRDLEQLQRWVNFL